MNQLAQTNNLYNDIVLYLNQNKKIGMENFQQTIIPGSGKVVGIETKFIKKLAINLLKEYELNQLIRILPDHDYFEIDLLKGFLIAYAKINFDDKIKILSNFAKTINNWAICDQTVCATTFKNENKTKLLQITEILIKSSCEFECRFGIILLLKYFIEEEYLNKITELLQKVKYGSYYVDMGVAWLLSIMYVKFPDYTYNLLINQSFSNEVILKTIQKIIDSLRVSSENKNKVRLLRIKIREKDFRIKQ